VGSADFCPGLAEETETGRTGVIDIVLKKAGRRHFANLALDYLAIAASVGAVGVILLLFFGTQIMDWYWPVLLFLGGLAVGLHRARRQRLTRYGVAQVVDARLGLDDRISTVVWFRDQQHEAPGGIETVERQANERLQADDAVRAVPVRMPRHAWVSLALVAAAAGMVGVRYGVLRSLDLSAPLARIDLGVFQPEPKVHAATKKSAIQERYEQQLKELGINVEDLEKEKGIQPIEATVPAMAEDGSQADAKQQKGDTKQPAPEGVETGEDGEQSQGDTKEASDNQSGDQQGQQGKPNAQQKPPQNAKQGQQGPENSLMNKMRDALANMLNKLKTPPQSSDQQTASNQQSQQQSGKQGQQSQQGMQSKNKSQGEGQQGQQQEGDQESEGQQTASDKSRAGDKSSDQPGSQDSKSGMGLSDGDKEIREAEQLAAMGKISEIFGKRAQEITGEISVEVASGKQQLKTAWSERKALHSDTGAEVNRDEIPLAYQRYIQRYFEEVRKSPGAPKPAKSGS
jgi:hypothetical protein